MKPDSWRRNLFAISVAEFVVVMGFDSVTSFLPLFVQKMGNSTNEEAALWAGIASGASGIGMFFTAPLWGIIADRWGRKPMVLRAMFGGAVVAALTGLAPNVFFLVGLRFIHGMFSGVVAASSALIAGSTPRNKMPFAMGLLLAAAFGGQTVGPLLGGLLADSFGYQVPFFVTGACVLAGGLIVLFYVKEDFEPPEKRQSNALGTLWRLARSREMLPLLITLAALTAGPKMVSPIIPLLMNELDSGSKVATASGLALGLMGIIAGISSVIAGRLGERVALKKILVFSCLGTSLLYLPPMWAATAGQLVFFVAATGLLKGGLVASPNALVGLSVQHSEQGTAYGLAQSAKALGSACGPLIGGSLAPLLGLRAAFGAAGGLFVLVAVGVAVMFIEKRAPLSKATESH